MPRHMTLRVSLSPVVRSVGKEACVIRLTEAVQRMDDRIEVLEEIDDVIRPIISSQTMAI